MAEFQSWFLAKYGARFPVALDLPVVELDADVFGSPSMVGRFDHPPMVPAFSEEPTAYVMTGAWGHGVNSYAFYWVEKREAHRRFFRLLSGGVYAPTDHRQVLTFLERYEAWKREHERATSSSTIIANMGDCTGEIIIGGRRSTLDVDEDELWDTITALHRPA